jgi:hypothetical protein
MGPPRRGAVARGFRPAPVGAGVRSAQGAASARAVRRAARARQAERTPPRRRPAAAGTDEAVASGNSSARASHPTTATASPTCLDGARRPRPVTVAACCQLRFRWPLCSACSAEPYSEMVLVLFGLEGFIGDVLEDSAALCVEIPSWPVEAVARGRLAVIDLFCTGFGVIDGHVRRGFAVVGPVRP